MKTIRKKDYHNDGIYINLDVKFVPYQNLLNNHYKYLSKDKKYYFQCSKGVKSRKVASILEAYGYDTTVIID